MPHTWRLLATSLVEKSGRPPVPELVQEAELVAFRVGELLDLVVPADRDLTMCLPVLQHEEGPSGKERWREGPIPGLVDLEGSATVHEEELDGIAPVPGERRKSFVAVIGSDAPPLHDHAVPS